MVAVVAHHKVAVCRHGVGSVVAGWRLFGHKAVVQLNGLAIRLGHIDYAVDHLHRLAGQAHNALDIILLLIVRVLKNDNVVPLGVVLYIGQAAGNHPVALLNGVQHRAGGHHGIGDDAIF